MTKTLGTAGRTLPHIFYFKHKTLINKSYETLYKSVFSANNAIAYNSF